MFEKSDVVVNLAGHSIAKLWTKQNQKRIRESRIYSTRAIAQAINACKNPPSVLVQASAVGIYPYNSQATINENSPIGKGFLADICENWENEAMACAERTRLIIIRTGVVLSNRGGFLPQIVTPIKHYFGALLGNSKQVIPWIHIDDHIKAILFLIENQSAKGVYNLTGPANDNLKTIAKTAAKLLKKPVYLNISAHILNLLPGNMAKEVLLTNQTVEPMKLKELGFTWTYSNIEQALQNLLVSEDNFIP